MGESIAALFSSAGVLLSSSHSSGMHGGLNVNNIGEPQ
jgi:hypothetical protein